MEQIKYRRAWWVTFNGRTAACIEAGDETDAKETAKAITGFEVLSVQSLPYPAEPRIGDSTGTPSFCFNPGQCAGLTACPGRRSCVE